MTFVACKPPARTSISRADATSLYAAMNESETGWVISPESFPTRGKANNSATTYRRAVLLHDIGDGSRVPTAVTEQLEDGKWYWKMTLKPKENATNGHV